MKTLLLAGAAVSALVAHAVSAAEPAQSLQITVVPAQPLLERTLYGQAMNCDFRVANHGSEALELRVVNLSVRDKTGALIAKLFTVVDADGNRYRGSGEKHEDHFAYGRAVLAPGDGTVVLVQDGVSEEGSGEVSIEAVKKNGMVIFGNYLVIDHGNGEFSHLGHLFPHLHYELAASAGTEGDGLRSRPR